MLRCAADGVFAQVDVRLLPTAGTVYETTAVAAELLQLNSNLGLHTSFVNLRDLAPVGFGGNALPGLGDCTGLSRSALLDLRVSVYPLSAGARICRAAARRNRGLLAPVAPGRRRCFTTSPRIMNPQVLRLRFFTPVRGLTHPVAARLAQLDYDRELALLAEFETGGHLKCAFLCRPRQTARRVRQLCTAIGTDAVSGTC